MLPKISVIIPNYNRTTVLQRAIRSAIEQTYPDLEIIVVDDKSSIDPAPSISEIKDNRVKLIRLDRNGGAARARNKGAELATGKYIAFLDSDDEWMPGYLKRRMNILSEQKPDGCYGAVFKFKGGKIIDAPPVRLPRQGESMATYLISGTLRAATPGLVIDKKAFLDIKFDERLIVHEDYDMLIRFSKKYKWACDKVPGVKVHISDTGLSASFDFPSSISFLKRHGAAIDFKWLLFYCLRKTTMAKEQQKGNMMVNYLNILEEHKPNTTFFYRMNFHLFRLFPDIYLFLFEEAIAAAYKMRKIQTLITQQLNKQI